MLGNIRIINQGKKVISPTTTISLFPPSQTETSKNWIDKLLLIFFMTVVLWFNNTRQQSNYHLHIGRLFFSRSVMSNSLWPHGVQQGWLLGPSLSPWFAQTHVHWVKDAMQPSHSLLASSPLGLNLSQHQGLFQGVSSSHQVAKAMELQLQHQFFQWIFRVDFL